MTPRTGTDEWNRKQKNCTARIAGAHPPTTVLSRWMGVYVKYTKTRNVLETITRFQKQFPNSFHNCRHFCSNVNYTGRTYCNTNCPLLFVCTVSSDSVTVFEIIWLFPEHYQFLYTLKTIKHPFIFRKKCGLECAPTNFVNQLCTFFCFLLHSSVPLPGFTYRKALEQLQNTWLCNTCDHPFV